MVEWIDDRCRVRLMAEGNWLSEQKAARQDYDDRAETRWCMKQAGNMLLKLGSNSNAVGGAVGGVEKSRLRKLMTIKWEGGCLLELGG